MIHLWVQRASSITNARPPIALSSGEKARADQLSAAARTQYVARHTWARECLATLLEMPAGELRLNVADCGALSVDGSAHHVSLSHHGEWLAFGASDRTRLGIDVLTVPPDADFVIDTGFVLSPDEISFVRSCPRHRQGARFAMCWARKEALAKLRRTGLTAELAEVTLTPTPVRATGTSFWTGQVLDAMVAVATTASAPPAVALHGFEALSVTSERSAEVTVR